MCFAETFFDLLKPHGTLAIMTSRMGSLNVGSNSDRRQLGSVSREQGSVEHADALLHQRHRGDGRTLLLLHPGGVKTDMGGPDAPVDLATSVEGSVRHVAQLGATGEQAFLDYQGNVLPW